MSAGNGVMHSEYNASNNEPVKFLQIWIQPNKKGVKPSYEQKHIPQKGPLTPLINATGENGAISIQQDASLSRLLLNAKEQFQLTTQSQIGYLHIVKGELKIESDTFVEGDAIAVEPSYRLALEAKSPVEALWFEL
jgi:redox-sensitive bicupin YhaK (pirin superfamily)